MPDPRRVRRRSGNSDGVNAPRAIPVSAVRVANQGSDSRGLARTKESDVERRDFLRGASLSACHASRPRDPAVASVRVERRSPTGGGNASSRPPGRAIATPRSGAWPSVAELCRHFGVAE